jgi:hypothetical protein
MTRAKYSLVRREKWLTGAEVFGRRFNAQVQIRKVDAPGGIDPKRGRAQSVKGLRFENGDKEHFDHASDGFSVKVRQGRLSA